MNEEQEYIWKAVGWTPEEIHNLAMSMLTAPETKALIENLEMQMESIVDEQARQRLSDFIAGMKMVLNE